MEKNDYPRVLIISHNCFSKTKNNGKTLSAIFEGWPDDKIAQVYFYNELPDTSVCKDYFRITDERMLRNRRDFAGEKVNVSLPSKNPANTTVSRRSWIRKYRNFGFFGFLRNVLWSSGKWNGENLRKWLDEFCPQVVFLVGGDSVFSYGIAKKISEEFSVPLFLYYTDDYITPRFTFDPFWWINFLWLWRSLKKVLPQVSRVFVIGEDMASEYEEKLGKTCIPIMNSVDVEKFKSLAESAESKREPDETIRFGYFGGLHLKRWKSLIRLGEGIKAVTERTKIDASLSIYSMNSLSKRMASKIRELEPHVKFAGSVDEKEIIAEMMKYDILVHAESFDRINRHKTRLSISTKIPEYLATGKPVIAIGPEEIASIKYLAKTGSANVVNSLNAEGLEKTLLTMFADFDSKKRILKENIELARRNHSSEIIRRKVLDVLVKYK